MKAQLALVFILVGLLIGLVVYHYTFSFEPKKEERISSAIILQKIETVSKLVTAEGTYSNIYQMEDHYFMDWGPFRKQATIKVILKVLIGIDLRKIEAKADEEHRVIRLKNIPDVEPIAIDTRVDYFDISEGVFNQYTNEDLNKINDVVRGMAEDGITYGKVSGKDSLKTKFIEKYDEEMVDFFEPLVKTARQEAIKKLQAIEFIALSSGWAVEYEGNNAFTNR
jgi:hypothetical protein